MSEISDRIRKVGEITEEAERLFESKMTPQTRRIVGLLTGNGFSKVLKGTKAGGGSYTNPQGDTFYKPTPAGVGKKGMFTQDLAQYTRNMERQLLKFMKEAGLTENHPLGDQVGLSEPGSHPIVWYHWIKGGGFYVDVDYTSDY